MANLEVHISGTADLTSYFANTELSNVALRDLRSKSLEIQTRLDNIAAAMSRLQRERQALQKQMRICSSGLAPVRRIPIEVLSTIFSYTMEDSELVVPWHEATAAPFSLLLVCSRWRDIAMRTSQIWKKIHFDCDQLELSSPKGLVQLMGQLMSRGNGALNSLHISGHTIFGRRYLGRGSASILFRIVHSHFGKVQKIILEGNDTGIRRILQGDPVPDMALTSLDIEVQQGGIIGRGSYPLLRYANSIRHVRIHSATYDEKLWTDSSEGIPLPWSTVTHLEISGIEMPAGLARNILNQCTQLEQCSIDIGPVESSLISPLTLPSLSTLFVRHKDGIREFFTDLATPTLVQLKLSYLKRKEDLQDVLVYSAIKSLVSTTAVLEELDIDFRFPKHIADDLLARLPKLVRLSLPRGQPLSDSTLKKIAAGDYARRLQSLEVMCEVPSDTPALISMLQSRSTGTQADPVALREVIIHATDPTGSQLLHEYKDETSALRDSGMYLQVILPPRPKVLPFRFRMNYTSLSSDEEEI